MIDVRLDREFKDGVRCVFTKDGSSKSTSRVFESQQAAMNFAVFLAAQNGVIEADRLRIWLEHRGFHVDSMQVADREEAARRLAAAGPFTLQQGRRDPGAGDADKPDA